MKSAEENPKLVVNQHYDESIEVNDGEDVASLKSPSPIQEKATGTLRVKSAKARCSEKSSQNESDDPSSVPSSSPKPGEDMYGLAMPKSVSDGESEETDSSSTDEDNAGLTGSYNPSDYEHLSVSQEIKELFQYIPRFTPQTIELEHKLKPFNPDYIPAVGDIDAFLKVARPDGKSVTLGLTVLDEPCAKQSDPTVLDLHLRSITKTSGARAIQVRSIKNAENNKKALDNWIENIQELHKSKPPPTVHYAKRMPEVDVLMQEWPVEVEQLLSKISLPTADLNCSLQTYTDIICSILDVPIYKSKIQSLFAIFSLYAAFKELHQFEAERKMC